jgi:hypothetical protein
MDHARRFHEATAMQYINVVSRPSFNAKRYREDDACQIAPLPLHQ